MLLAITASLWTAATASAEVSWKVYDLRDLIGLIPPKAPPTPSPAVDDDDQMFDFGEPKTAPVCPSVPDPAASVEELVGRICDALSVTYTSLLAGVYGVEAEDDQHAEIQELVSRVRDLYAERYEVELVWFTTSSSTAPSVADKIALPELPHRHQLVVTRRTPTPVAVVTRHTYLSDLAAIVGTGATAYDPETASVQDGFELSMLVGADEERGDATSIRLAGEFRRVTLGKTAAPLAYQETTISAIELPTVAVRSVQADLPVEARKVTVLSVLDGFAEGECVVLAASIQKLQRP
jgi:hypothetical protein